MPIFRSSELDRLMDCPGSAWLPRRKDQEGVAAAWGTYVHGWMETGTLEESVHKKLLEKKLAATGVKREELWPDVEFEVPLAYNLVTGAVARYTPIPLPPGVTLRAHKSAWKDAFDDEWMVGTLDAAGELMDSWWVDDLKTGREAGWADYRWQQTSYAIMWSAYKYGTLQDGRSTITHWPRYRIDTQPKRGGSVLTQNYLEKSLDALKELRLEIQKQDPAKLETGAQCRFCPSQDNCPIVVPIVTN